MSIWVKICKYLEFGQNFPKISIFINIFKNIDFGENWWKIWNLEKSWFWWKFTKMSILVKIAENVDYSENFRKMSTWVKICKYLDFGQKLFSKNLDFH